MALDEKKLADQQNVDEQQKVDEQERTERKKLAEGRKLKKARGRGYGLGLLKGMAVTFKHLFKHNTVIQYPDEKQDLPSRTRGVIALKEENCTVCMLCARECPDWCIYIDSHKEQLPPKREGGRPRKRNVLDRFAIDYALCMYCGICVEVCPYDALFWSREFEYSEYDIRELTHEKEKLSDWMSTVLPPPELEVGADVPGQPAASGSAAPAGATAPASGPPAATGAPAVAAGGAGPGSAQRPSPPAAATAAAERPEQAQRQPAAAATAAPTQDAASVSQEEAGEVKAPHAEGRDQATEEKAPAGEGKPQAGTATGTDAAQPEAIKSETEAKSPDQLERPEDDKAATTTEPQRQTGTEAAAVEAGGTPHTTPGTSAQATPEGQSVQEKGESAPGPEGAASTEGDGATKELSAAERAKFQESPGPNVEVPQETPQPVALQPTEDADAVYQQVLQEQLEKGSSAQVAEARAKVARAKAARGIKRGPTPIQTDKMVPSAPTKGHPTPQEPSGAPEAKDVTPDPGPVAPAAGETSGSTPPPDRPQENAAQHTAPPEAAREADRATTSATEGGGDADAQPQADSSPASPAAVQDAGSTDATPPTAASETEGVAEASAPAEKAGQPEPGAPAAATAASGDDPDAVYERVLAEEKAKGSSDAVAMGRAKAARVKAERAQKKAGG